MSRAEAGTGTVRVTDLAVSIIRTWVPIAVGAAITWMCARTGLVVTDSWTILAAVWAQAGVTAAYYAAARYGGRGLPVGGSVDARRGYPPAGLHRPADVGGYPGRTWRRCAPA